MSWLQLDPNSVVERVKLSGQPAEIPSLAASWLRGVVGFTVVSVAGFAPWAVFGRWFHEHTGEAGMYAVCALVFIVLAGLLMHRLIIGPGSLSRFYKLFGLSFAAYSAGWTAGWMSLRGDVGGAVGLLLGAVLMGWIIAHAFGASRSAPKIIAALFIFNVIGYFGGGAIYDAVAHLKGLPLAKPTQNMIARLSWGVSYGIGFGAGLGMTFHFCQAKTRALLKGSLDQLSS